VLPSVRQREIWPFLSGVFLICSCGLMLQIVQTRIISVILYYHLAFFAISMAMLGMTAGSLLIYFRTDWFPRERLFENLVWIGAAFSISVVLSTLSLITTIAPSGIANTLLMTSVVWLKLILILLPPYVLAGMAISMALTRSPYPVGVVLWDRFAGCGLRLPDHFAVAVVGRCYLGAVRDCYFRGHRSGMLRRRKTDVRRARSAASRFPLARPSR